MIMKYNRLILINLFLNLHAEIETELKMTWKTKPSNICYFICLLRLLPTIFRSCDNLLGRLQLFNSMHLIFSREVFQTVELFENSFRGPRFCGFSVLSGPRGPWRPQNSPGHQCWPVFPGLYSRRSLKKINRNHCHQSESTDSVIYDRFLYGNDTRPTLG